MTTLEALAFNAVAGSMLGLASFFAFGVAVVKQHEFIAPRCAARPKEVIYNPHQSQQQQHLHSGDNHNTRTTRLPKPSSAWWRRGKRRVLAGGCHRDGCCLVPGPTTSRSWWQSLWCWSSSSWSSTTSPPSPPSPLWGWIPWTLQLSYDTLLQGIPGTGTRDQGRSGTLLRCNLDAVVLLRFHALGLKVSVAATLLFLFFLFPLYWTAECHKQQKHGGDGEDWRQEACASQAYSLTDYERTTIANVPAYLPDEPGALMMPHVDAVILYHQYQTVGRLYMAAFTFWILTAYLLYLLQREWIEILALRRVYYLEANVWGERTPPPVHPPSSSSFGIKEEPQRELRPEEEEYYDEDNNNKEDDEYSYLVHRDPWIPHPEQRETVSNIQLYSVLVGGLPTLPEDFVVTAEPGGRSPTTTTTNGGYGVIGSNHHPRESSLPHSTTQMDANPNGNHHQHEDDNNHHNNDRMMMMDCQLALTAAFFDHCVPNQPGFSSSVAAVTLLPSSRAIAVAWSKWYKAAGQLRRWQFIRAQISKKLHYTQGYHDDDDEEMEVVLSTKKHGDDEDDGSSSAQDSTKFSHRLPSRLATWDSNLECESQQGDTQEGIEVGNFLPHALLSVPPPKRVPHGYRTSISNASDDVDEEKQQQRNHENNDRYKVLDESWHGVVPQSWHAHSNHGVTTRSNDDDVEEGGPTLSPELPPPPRPQMSQQQQSPSSVPLMMMQQGIHSFGPEQVAIYNREVAQSAAACCPFGCWEGAILHATIDELLILEQEAAANVHLANMELSKARQDAILRHHKPPRYPRDNNNTNNNDSTNNNWNHENTSQSARPRPLGSSNDAGGVTLSNQYHSTATTNHGDNKYENCHKRVEPPEHNKYDNCHKRVEPPEQPLEFTQVGGIPISPHSGASIISSVPSSFMGLGDSMTVVLPDIPTMSSWIESQLSLLHTEGTTLPVSRRRQPQRSRSFPQALRSRQQVQPHEKEEYGSASEKERNSKWFSSKLRGATLMEGGYVFTRTNTSPEAPPNSSTPSTPTTKTTAPAMTPPLEAAAVRAQLPSDLAIEAELLFQQRTTTTTAEIGPSHSFGLPRHERSLAAAQESPSFKPIAKNQLDQEKMRQQPKSAERDHRSNAAVFPFMDGNGIPGQHRQETILPVDTAATNYSGWEALSIGDTPLPMGITSETAPEVTIKWGKVQSIVTSTHKAMYPPRRRRLPPGQASREVPSHHPTAISGEWRLPSFRDLLGVAQRRVLSGTHFLTKQTEAMDPTRESSYAIVTFTSRQAALAARHCLADARGGTDRWKTDEELPIPPLADAAAWDLCVCRNCCRPVAITIDSRQKGWRLYSSLLLLATFYIFSTLPLTLVTSYMDPKSLEESLPRFFKWADRNQEGAAELMSGFLQSLVFTAFFALCPLFFKIVANFGSNANSVANAELRALQFFWWFMVVSAFSSTLIANMVLSGFSEGYSGGEVRAVLRSIAQTVPSTTAATWLNWIIFRTTVTLPALYLLQINSFLWDFLGCRCCSRLSRGGGPGPSPPYRLYVDSGVVLMCLLALGPASPLVAPAAFLYFLVCQPLLRRCCIFVYRPKFDGGGLRWPFIFDMIVSSLFVGQILLTIQMVLKQSVGPAIASAAPMLPTLLSVMNMKKKFLRSFRDVALLQTSLLDGWDPASKDWSTMQKREEFRRFLVDAHKAAYVPVCLASTNAHELQELSMTAEPAVVVPLETDMVGDNVFLHPAFDDDSSEGVNHGNNSKSTRKSNQHHHQDDDDRRRNEICSPRSEMDAFFTADWDALERGNQQYGATLRRAGNTLSALRQRAMSITSNGSSIRCTSKHGGSWMEVECTNVDPLRIPRKDENYHHHHHDVDNDNSVDTDDDDDRFSWGSLESKQTK